MKLRICYLLLLVFISFSCEETIDPDIYSEMAPENLLKTETGLKSALNSAYSQANLTGWNGHSILNMEEMTTDFLWSMHGGESRHLSLMYNFTWDPSEGWFNSLFWNLSFTGIRNANVILDNLEHAKITEEKKMMFGAEARFLRAITYYRMYTWMGPVPLRTSMEQEMELSRASEEEMKTFIEEELLAIIPDLPEFGDEEQYGRAHKSAARAYLTKLYLNTKQWQKCADMAETIINEDNFSLFPSYFDLWDIKNEENSEFIWVSQSVVPPSAAGAFGGWNELNGCFPAGFKKDPKTGITWTDNMNNWAVDYRVYDEFYNSFSPEDERDSLLMDEYINFAGDTISLRGEDNIRFLKPIPDPNANGNYHGNDFPEIRYADILLSRAEALNELNGPTDESLNLINLVRNRAGLDDLQLSDFGSKQELRDHILKERGWEFYAERKRRQDLIRHGKFIQKAHERGVTRAEEFHRRYPIPQPAMDANPKLEQNPGY